MSEEIDIDNFTTIKTCILNQKNKKALEFYLDDIAKAKQECKDKLDRYQNDFASILKLIDSGEEKDILTIQAICEDRIKEIQKSRPKCEVGLRRKVKNPNKLLKHKRRSNNKDKPKTKFAFW
ncbi:MAG: hypothetical protein ABIC57_01110 [bacterium]